MLRRLCNVPIPSRHFLWGPCLYFARGYTALLETSHLRRPGGHAKASPMRKRVRALRYIVQIYPNEKKKNGKKKKICSTSPFGYFPPVGAKLLVGSVSGTDGHHNGKGQAHDSSSKCSLSIPCSINEHYMGYL